MQTVFTGFVVKALRAARNEVRIGLERNKAESVEGRGLCDRHVVSGAQRRASDVAACGPAAVRNAGVDAFADQIDDARFVHTSHQSPGVAAADSDRLGFAHSLLRILNAMNAHDLVAVGLEGILNLFFVGVVGSSHLRIRNEENFVLFFAEQFFVLITRKVQIAGIVITRARLDQHSALRANLHGFQRRLLFSLSNRAHHGSGAQ